MHDVSALQSGLSDTGVLDNVILYIVHFGDSKHNPLQFIFSFLIKKA